MTGTEVWLPVEGAEDESLVDLAETVMATLTHYGMSPVEPPSEGRGSPVEIKVVFPTQADAEMARVLWKLAKPD